MARIPVANQVRELPAGPNQLPSVRMTAAPTAQDLNAQTRVPNEEANRALSGAARDLADAQRAIQSRTDAATVLAIESEAKRMLASAEADWISREGLNANGLTGEARKWFDETHAKLSEKLANPRQQRAFDEAFQRLRVAGEVGVSKHEARENRKAVVEGAKASIAGSIELAAMHADDEQIVTAARNEIIDRTKALASAAGMDKKAAALEELKHLSQFHESVLTQKLQRGTSEAAEYFKANSGEMNATTRARAEATLKAKTTLERAQTFADSAMEEGLSEADAIKKARSELSGDEEKAAITEIKTRFSEINQQRERLQREAADKAWTQYTERGSYTRIDADVWAALDGKDKQALVRAHEQKLATEESRAAARESRDAAREAREERAADRADRQRERELRARDMNAAGTYYDLRTLAMNEPERFQALDLRRYAGELGPQQMTSLVNLQTAARKPEGDPTKLDAATLTQQIRRTAQSLGLEKVETANLELKIEEAVNNEQVRLGKKLTQKERQEVIDRLTMEVKVGGWIWDSTKRVFQLKDGEATRAYVPTPGVPQEASEKITQGLLQRGIKPTPEAIKRVYQLNGGTK